MLKKLSIPDREFCEKIINKFNNTKKTLIGTIGSLEDNKEYYYNYKDFLDMLIESIKTTITNIYIHFNSKYKLKLTNNFNTNSLFKTLGDVANFNLEEVLKDIEKQINGFDNLNKLLEEEIKKDVSNLYLEPKVSKNKISLKNFIYVDRDGTIGYSNGDKIQKVFRFINLIINNQTGLIKDNMLRDITGYVSSEKKEQLFQIKQIEELNLEMQIFKNGRLDLIFKDINDLNKVFKEMEKIKK